MTTEVLRYSYGWHGKINMTHRELCSRAASWLKNTLNCRCVITEPGAIVYGGEIPDVLGWVNQRCILIECKTSLADFRADQQKQCRRSPHHVAKAMGHWRFYFAPQGVLPHDKVPEGWGLYEVCGRSVKHASGIKYANARPGIFTSNKDSEITMLLHHINRITTKGVK